MSDSSFGIVSKQNGRLITCSMSNGDNLLKDLISLLPMLLGVRNVKTTCKKSWPGSLFQLLHLIFNPCFKFKWG